MRIFFFDFLYHEGMLCVLIRIASKEYTEHTIINIKKKIKKKIYIIMSAAMEFFPRGSRTSS